MRIKYFQQEEEEEEEEEEIIWHKQTHTQTNCRSYTSSVENCTHLSQSGLQLYSRRSGMIVCVRACACVCVRVLSDRWTIAAHDFF